MNPIYYYDEPPESYGKSIFLAGPSPRKPDIPSWRPEALSLLRSKGYDGAVFIPEPKPGKTDARYDWLKAPQWEYDKLAKADIILFWVARDMRLMPESVFRISRELTAGKTESEITNSHEPELRLPGMTTNIEFGHWANSGKAVLGFPAGTPHAEYFSRFLAPKFHVPAFESLEEAIDKALEIIGDGALRKGGERNIPLNIWRMRAFQNWYQAQLNAGNRLDGATIEWVSRVRNNPNAIFAAAIRPNIYVANENRNKLNDPVVLRLDISSVVMYGLKTKRADSEIVLVREFRSAASTSDGFIWELPGGSSPYITNPLEVAVEEVKEEVGLEIRPSRFKYVGSRQLAGTLSGHKSHTFAVELTEEELAWLKTQKGIPHGTDYPDNPTGERAYTEVVTLKEIMYNNLVDFANLGMIRSAL